MHTQSTHRFDPDDTYPPPHAQDVGTHGNPDRVLLNLTPDLMLAGDRAQLAQVLRAGLTALYRGHPSVDADRWPTTPNDSQSQRWAFGAMGMVKVGGDDDEALSGEAARND